MSHTCGTVPVLTPSMHIGPDSGAPADAPNTWTVDFAHTPAPTGTKFVILHFMNVTLPASNRLEVDLGYDTDVFTSADGNAFWTRPVNIHALAGGTIPIRYITSGSGSGGAFLDRYGRGESLQSYATGHDSITNCDPFLPGAWVEPNFPHVPGSTAPKYDPFWICDKTNPPAWQNVRCAPGGTIQRTVAESVGMIVTVHGPSASHPEESVSTCSVTLIDSDLVLLAGHCVSDHPFEVPTSSVTFDFEVACDGSVLPAYNAVFYKVIKLVKYRYSDGRDYAILQIRGAPPRPPAPVRNTLPAMDEAVFGVHHPNGAVKKVSPSATGTTTVVDNSSYIRVNLDVSGGSSGSGLFDTAGRVTGVAAFGSGCQLYYSPTSVMLDDPIIIPDPPEERAVMLVIDRSGSMSEPTLGGGSKIAEARDAAELFISLLRTIGNEAGLVSFASDASSPVDFGINTVTNGRKTQMINLLPGITPGGRTSIGDGLAAARTELNTTAGLPKSMLVLTDGMENEPQAIADVTGLAGVQITAIGFGTASNLDGPKLTDLAQTHGGFYKRAGTGLELRKFFALAFGEIFEAGALADPELHLSRTMREGPKVPFDVCEEEAVTVVVGWDTIDAPLLLEITTPSGQVVNLGAGGVEQESGKTWRFARLPLPQNGEREGTWHARVRRPDKGSAEFPPPAVPVTYFINVIARGGPILQPYQQPFRLYTGDVLHPKVLLQYPDETVPRGATATLTLRRPDASVGTILSAKGIGAEKVVDGDVIPARLATLGAIEAQTGQPVNGYVEETHLLTDDAVGSESFADAGVFGRRLPNALVVDGTYTFHAKARIEREKCTTTREVQWSHHVHVGVDPGSTPVDIDPNGEGPGGGDRITVTITPRDRFGNHVGPGAGGDLDVDPLPGCIALGPLKDRGDGRYSIDLECDPDEEVGPGIVVNQPGRDPVVLVSPLRERRIYRYAVQIVCGPEKEDCCTCASLVPGRYATAITVLNSSRKETRVTQHLVPTVNLGAIVGRWPDTAGPRAKDRMALPPMQATTIDCCSLHALLLGASIAEPQGLTFGVVLIESAEPLQVTATYTMATTEGVAASIDVERIVPEIERSREKVPPPPPPDRKGAPPRRSPPPRPGDVPRREDKEVRPKEKSASEQAAPAARRARSDATEKKPRGKARKPK